MSQDSFKNYSLVQIASWQVDGLEQDSSVEEIAGLPQMQRGAVWGPQQVEMLWDSVFRGFPVGAIILSKPIDGQGFKKSVVNAKIEQDKSPTHHILDGQQRTNAIAWGFDYPDPEKEIDKTQCVWIDLNPPKGLKGGRKYLFRVTTKAHPWGFQKNESFGRLGLQKIKEFND